MLERLTSRMTTVLRLAVRQSEIGPLRRRTGLWLLCLLCVTSFAQVGERTFNLDGWNLPVRIAVLKDVTVGASERVMQTSPGQSPVSEYSVVELDLRKDAVIQMIEIHGEGGCLIRYNDKDYGLGSCPWLPGFRDHQNALFMVLDHVATD